MSSGIFEDLMNYRGGLTYDMGTESKPKEVKKLKPSEQLLQDIENEGFDMSQMKSVLTTRGNQLIVSCAGSGKTTALIFKIIYDMKTGFATRVIEVNGNPIRVPEKIWVSTFLHSGADELASALRKWQSKLHCVDTSQAIQFSTLHAEFKRALTAMGVKTNIVSSKDNSSYLKEVVKPYQLVNENGRPLNSDDYRDLESALTYTRNRLDNTRYEHDKYDELGIGATIIDCILRDWKAMRIKKGVCDFEDLQEMLYVECYEKNNEEVIRFLSERYNLIYIDEFQDTSQIQYKLLQVYGNECKQVVAIGDDDQTIYSWRGSDNSIITTKFMEDFCPVKNNLSINFRCPSNILDAIKPSIKYNTSRFEKELTSHNTGGRVRFAAMGSYAAMVGVLNDMIYQDVTHGRSVAVLCRVNSDGLMPALILDKLDKFSFSISGDGMTLDSYIGRTVLSIVKLFTERSTQSVKNALNLLAWDSYGINSLIKVCKANKISIWEIDEKDLAYSCPSIAERVMKWRGWRESMGEVQTLRMVLQDYRLAVFGKDTPFNNVMRSVISSVEALLDYFDYEYAEDFLFELEDINERLKARKKRTNVKVQIATVHEFKGKEADSVYVWNDSEGVYPIKDAEEQLETLEEERRIHYIACTRAKEINTLIFLRNKPGMFINEMDFSNAEEITTESNGVVGMIKKDMEENKNLNKFEKSRVEGFNGPEGDDEFVSFLNEEDLYENNPFWGKDE